MALVDIFAQTGFQIYGTATLVAVGTSGFDALAAPLAALAGPDFPIRAVISVTPRRVAPIVAPSYRLFPDRTEAEQTARAMARSRVRPL